MPVASKTEIKRDAPKIPKSGKIKKVTKTPSKEKTKLLVLKDTNALQIITAGYAGQAKTIKKSKKIRESFDDDNEISEGDIHQTFVSSEEEEFSISDLMHEKSKRCTLFLNSHKTPVKSWGCMIDVTQNGPLPLTTKRPCWWCHHSFTTSPVGCPQIYHPNLKTPNEETQRFIEKLKKANYPTDTNDFFETEGYFCSGPCCKAYILDQGSSVKYKNSLSLLSLLFYKYHGVQVEIPRAPSCKVLKAYGGHLTIQEFRAAFGRLDFIETVNIRRPYMFCTSQYLEENRIKPFRGIRETPT
jgi:hypothetical protein